MIDRTGRIVSANGEPERMFGYERGELASQSVDTLLPERLRGAHARQRGAFFADPRVRRMGLGVDLVARRKDGHELPVDISLSFIEKKDEFLALAFVTDITPRKEAERRLQAEFAVTRVFAETAPIEALPAACFRHWARAWGGSSASSARRRRPAPVERELACTGSRPGRLRRGQPGPGLCSRRRTTRVRMGRRPRAVGGGRPARSRLRPGDRCGPARAAGGVRFPIQSERGVTGVVVLLSRVAREPDDALLAMLTDVGRRSASTWSSGTRSGNWRASATSSTRARSSPPSDVSWPGSPTR